jgi:hypothetical protein
MARVRAIIIEREHNTAWVHNLYAASAKPGAGTAGGVKNSEGNPA